MADDERPASLEVAKALATAVQGAFDRFIQGMHDRTLSASNALNTEGNVFRMVSSMMQGFTRNAHWVQEVRRVSEEVSACPESQLKL